MPREDTPQNGPRGSSTTDESEKPMYPCPEEFIEYGNYLEPRPGHLHAGEDFSCPGGTPMTACEDGVVTEKSDPTGYGTYIDLNVGKYSLRYAHLSSIRKTGKVLRGDVIGISNNTGSSQGDHLHFEVRTDGGGFGEPTANTVAPEDYLTGAIAPGGGGSGGSEIPGESGAGGLSEGDIFAIGRAAAISTTLELPGLMNFQLAQIMTGDKSIYNDEPLLPFIQQLAQASLRHFQSLPDGTFFAFFPDYFGTYNHRKPYWAIDDIEIIDGSIHLNDEALATHVFVVGDMLFDGAIDEPDMVASTGVVTVFDAFASGFMFEQTKDEKDNKPGKTKDKNKMARHLEAREFLKRYGVRPHFEEALFIRNHMFETFYAFTQFQLLWSRQFLTEFQMTFMPELYPGGVVAFPNHEVRCYVDSVTHTFDYEGGFTTQVALSAPAAYGKGAPSVSHGMIKPITKKSTKGRQRPQGFDPID